MQRVTGQGNKTPDPPQKPKFRSLKKVAKNIQVMPYLIDGYVDEEGERPLLHPENVVVALAPLKYRSYLVYENRNGETLDVSVSKIIYIVSAMFNALAGKEDAVKIEKDEFDRIITPFGTMYGSLERNVVDICTFILSQYGRIIKDNGDGTYEYEGITQEELLDCLDNSGNIFMEPDENGVPLLMEVFSMSGVYSMDEAISAQEDGVDDGPKNSASKKGGGVTTKSPSKKEPETVS